jgi:hypothetical protein
MPRSNRGRPASEITNDQTPIIPFDRFGRIGTADDTDTIQRAIDASSEYGIKVGQEGEFNVNKIILKDRSRIVAPGETSMRLIARVGSAEDSLVQLAQGVVQNVFLKGISLNGNVAGQAAMWLKAIPNSDTGVLQGGLWYFRFEDMEISGFTGADTIWFDGYGNAPGDPAAFQGPIQFGTMSNVRAFRGALDKRALRMSGQVGQINFDAGCQFDSSLAGYPDGGTAENILIERDVKSGGTHSDQAPYSINFYGTTCQGGNRGIRIERATGITMHSMHFENLKEGILNSVSAWGNSVQACVFGLVGVGTDGYGVKNMGGLISCRDLTFLGNASGFTQTHYISWFDQPIKLEGYHRDDTGIRTFGITRAAMDPAMSLDTGYSDHIYVNGPGGGIVIKNIVSQLMPGEQLTIRANAGSVILDNGTGNGAIDLGAFRAPARIPADSIAILQRDDLAGGPMKLVSIGGNRGHVRPLGTYVTAAMSPYSIPADLGTIRVDTTAGNVVLKLPSVSNTPPGHRISVFRVSGGSNTVYINGNTTAENPGGFSDNVIRLTTVLQSIDFERNGLIGEGGWDPLAGSDMHSGIPSVVDSTYLQGYGTIVARGPQGQVYLGTQPPISNPTLSLRGAVFSAAAPYPYGNALEWGHDNPSGYVHTLGTEPGTGYGFLGFHIEHGTSPNSGTYTTRGVMGILMRSDGLGGVTWQRAAAASQTNGSLVQLASLAQDGTFTSAVLAASVSVNVGPGAAYAQIASGGLTTNVPLLVNNYINVNRAASGPTMFMSSNVGDTGIAFSPASAGSTVYLDNSRVGSSMAFRTSSGSATDRTWLTVLASGAAQFSYAVTIANVLTVATTGGVTGINITDATGNTGISFTPANSSTSAFIDQRRVGSNTYFRQSSASAADTIWLTVTAAGEATFSQITSFSQYIQGPAAYFGSNTGSVAKLTYWDGTTSFIPSIDLARVRGAVFGISVSDSSGTYAGIAIQAVQLTATTGTLFGMRCWGVAQHSTGTVTSVVGCDGGIYVSGNTVTRASALNGSAVVTAGIVGELRMIHAGAPAISGGVSITTLYGLLIDAMTGATTNYAIKTLGGRVAFVGLPSATTGVAGDLYRDPTTGALFAA